MNDTVGFIARRYLRTRSGKGFSSLITVVSFVGLVLGVMALTVVVSVMNGFDRELKQRILGSIPHVIVVAADLDEVRSALAGSGGHTLAPFNESQVLLTAHGNNELTLVHGVEPGSGDPALLSAAMVAGSLDSLVGSSKVGSDTTRSNTIILGQGLARRLQVAPGDQLNLIVPALSDSGALLRPRLEVVTLGGLFRLGSELDYRLALMHPGSLQALTGEPVGVRIQLEDLFAAPAISRQLRDAGFEVRDWTDSFGDFFEAVRLEKIMMFILLSFVIAVASFSIVSSLSMLVDAKRQDIAVLRTMGFPRRGVLRLFLLQGVGISVSGVIAGLLIGVPLALNIPGIMAWVDSVAGFSIVRGTYFDQIPTDVRAGDLVVIAGISLLISLAATLYPASRAAALEPARILRYE